MGAQAGSRGEKRVWTLECAKSSADARRSPTAFITLKSILEPAGHPAEHAFCLARHSGVSLAAWTDARSAATNASVAHVRRAIAGGVGKNFRELMKLRFTPEMQVRSQVREPRHVLSLPDFQPRQLAAAAPRVERDLQLWLGSSQHTIASNSYYSCVGDRDQGRLC
jgi:hypothetical protein